MLAPPRCARDMPGRLGAHSAQWTRETSVAVRCSTRRAALPDVVAVAVRVALSHHLDIAAAGGPDGAANAAPGVTDSIAHHMPLGDRRGRLLPSTMPPDQRRHRP